MQNIETPENDPIVQKGIPPMAGATMLEPPPPTSPVAAPAPAKVRRLKVRHANRFEYGMEVNRSVHRLQLRPVHDRRQTVVSHNLQIDPGVTTHDYEDVFGNWATRFEINEPYTKLAIVAESIVELLDVDPFAFARVEKRPTFPVSWMPWEFTMLAPYLAPVELPETHLREIFDYAMSFVVRNKYDLLETLFDINLTMFREFTYVPMSTTNETTPFEVLKSKRGVCQDFANLVICMARMLNIPARYVCGYIFTGNTGPQRAVADASHAWLQLYLPGVGWKGFDPTNGLLPTTDHVRVSVGRHFRDTAPISGTIYSPANERLIIDVEVAEVE
ncbi:MAG TPA: transglutaminase family protein [Lacipirellulaceae bacterium]|jgi:transglutaminase-like putative cysteine protease|nr:transglutaminase family protein [Lacipirellulaceae bacterium]